MKPPQMPTITKTRASCDIAKRLSWLDRVANQPMTKEPRILTMIVPQGIVALIAAVALLRA